MKTSATMIANSFISAAGACCSSSNRAKRAAHIARLPLARRPHQGKTEPLLGLFRDRFFGVSQWGRWAVIPVTDEGAPACQKTLKHGEVSPASPDPIKKLGASDELFNRRRQPATFAPHYRAGPSCILLCSATGVGIFELRGLRRAHADALSDERFEPLRTASFRPAAPGLYLARPLAAFTAN